VATQVELVPCSFHLLFKEDFLVDKVSTENLSIQRTMNSMIPLFGNVHWRNNVLIVKAGKETDPKYEDLTVSDIPDAVDFLIKYTVTIPTNEASRKGTKNHNNHTKRNFNRGEDQKTIPQSYTPTAHTLLQSGSVSRTVGSMLWCGFLALVVTVIVVMLLWGSPFH
jgi:hypothetical protein